MKECLKQFQKAREALPKAIDALRGQNSIEISNEIQDLFVFIEDAANDIPAEHIEEFLEQNNNLLLAIEKEDYVLMADILEVYFLKLFDDLILNEMASSLIKEEPQISLTKEIFVEQTAIGRWTMTVRGRYLHSNCDPINEARLLAKKWYNSENKVALVWGLGLGYHVLALTELDQYQEIYVFEPDSVIVQAAKEYGVLTELEKTGRVTVFCDSTGSDYVRVSEQNPDIPLFVHNASLLSMPEGSMKKAISRYVAMYQSIEIQKTQFDVAFRNNIKLDYELFSKFSLADKERAFIVSAGPSLDGNYKELLRKGEKDAVIATAPTLRKLYSAGIMMDCVVISDTKNELKRLHNGAENADCPLIFSSTASPSFVADHKGKRYMLLQKGYKKAEEMAAKAGETVFEGSGSVAVTAINVAIAKGIKKIVLMGQDLCYLGDKMHASDTSKDFIPPSEKREVTKDIFGREVTVPMNLKIFKEEIEQIIRNNPQIGFLNATEGGLHIEGAKDVSLKDLL